MRERERETQQEKEREEKEEVTHFLDGGQGLSKIYSLVAVAACLPAYPPACTHSIQAPSLQQLDELEEGGEVDQFVIE